MRPSSIRGSVGIDGAALYGGSCALRDLQLMSNGEQCEHVFLVRFELVKERKVCLQLAECIPIRSEFNCCTFTGNFRSAVVCKHCFNRLYYFHPRLNDSSNKLGTFEVYLD